ncbi:inward rectifier potassium channel 2 family protein [Ancylostoma caninum]|uniref:Inward rectifier potassium channel 2 family protein n=2 Tax=Ancylostoma TaxID=29169 RepID=A0A368FIW2_ANCCA|nr:inward rectifier potassium channel 2 family protein [Ancylostoma caninum]
MDERERLSSDDTKKELNGWASAPRRARLVSKTGQTLLISVELPERFRATCKNWFHLIIECNWRLIILIFAAGFFGSWTFFGTLYYLFTVVGYQNTDRQCIENVNSFVTAFLFSMESQHTIGYGFRYMTDNCPPAYVILSIQLVVGVFLQTMLTGIVLAKVLRPKKRKQEMRFSRMAVIGPLDEHDRRPALMIRLADVQEKLFLAESHVRLYMASSRINNNTYSLMPNFLFQRGDRELIGVKDMNVGYDSGWDRVLLLWPIIVRHVIDESSPLYGLTRESLLSAEFELIMTVEGIVEATGMTFQARTSFLPDEILWGHKFKPMVLMNEKLSKYEVHYGLFDHTERVLDFDVAPVETEELEDELAHHNNASGFM